MKWLVKQPKPKQIELSLDDQGRPLAIETTSTAEFEAACRRIDSGELRLITLERGRGYTSRGFPAGNGTWIFRVRYNKQQERKLE